MTSRTAVCSCGQLRIEVEGVVGICHCLACQRRTGSVHVWRIVFDKGGPPSRGPK